MANIEVLNVILDDAQNLRSKFHTFKNTATPIVTRLSKYTAQQMEDVGMSVALATKIINMVAAVKRVGIALNNEINNLPDDIDLQ